jgi:translation initiation factor IF-2
MSKIRIYELAKELGVDNRVILSKAQEMGMKGKSSHSHSLEADEADLIRRAVIRQAMGTPKSSNSEVLTKRVDKVTGATEAVVERRSGDVIRRRRAADGPASVAQPVAAVEAPSETFEPEVTEIEPTMVISDGGAAREVSPEVVEPDVLTVVEPEVEAAPIPVEEEPEVVVESVVETVEAVDVVVAEQPVVAAATVVAKTAIGPRILGRIDLPVKRVITPATDAKRPAKGVVGRDVKPVVEIEEEGAPKKGFKKGRKREISSIDLLDYGAREGRKGKSKNSRRSDIDLRGAEGADGEKPKVAKRVIELGESITVGELARQMSLKSGEVIAKLLGLGVLATINQAIDKDTAQIVASDLGYEVKHVEFNEQDILKDTIVEDPAELLPRPPVVTVMGHVDHGKTSLLDRIRSASVAAKEAGGITQHIGAYSVTTADGRVVAFIDTPGHAAFTSMRARGAQVTDIVVLVVAADDGVMPQTKEAINHAQAAKVPIVVAVNKMDKQDANPDRVKTQLAELGLQPEDWGGDTMFFPISALRGDGIESLLEGILLLAEVKELKANPNRRAKGTVIESRQDRGRGVVATVLVQAGTLRVGDIFVSGAEYGRVRTMSDYRGERSEQAGPSTPVEITGLNGMPASGDDFFVVESEADAREVAGNRAEVKASRERALASGPISLEEFAKRATNQAAQELNVILKADVQGSVEAVKHSIERLSGDKVKVRVLHAAVGGVNESDVQLAIASRAIIVGFGVRAEQRAMADAEQSGIEIRFYRVIYELLDDVKKAMVGLLEPIKQESGLGRVEVRETFTVPKIGTIAGCYVTGGIIKRNAHARLLRDNRVIHEGKLGSLRRFKDDVKEVQAGFECGIGLDGFNDVKIGDVIEVFEIKEIEATLD